MGTKTITRGIFLLVIYVEYSRCLEMKSEAFAKNAAQCRKLGKDPYFDIDQVIGRPWRIYYTWSMQLENKCMDITFKNTTSMITNRIWNDMHEYLEEQPAWEAATMVSTMGPSRHELLLFADQGAAGSFVGVPNLLRDATVVPRRRSVPLLKLFLKLLQDGKYLLIVDCYIGVYSLCSREHPPYRAEVASLANSLGLGDGGGPACISEKKKDEEFLMK